MRIVDVLKDISPRRFLWRIIAATVLCLATYYSIGFALLLALAHAGWFPVLPSALLFAAVISAAIASFVGTVKVGFKSSLDAAMTGMLLVSPVPGVIIFKDFIFHSIAGGVAGGATYPISIANGFATVAAFVAGAGVGSYLSWRLSSRLNRPWVVIIASLLMLASPFFLVTWSTMISFPHWKDWHRSGAGLRVGMTRQEVVMQLKTRSRAVTCDHDDNYFCMYKPGGLARLSMENLTNGLGYFPFSYRVDLVYGPDGKLESWEPRTFSD